MAVIVNSVASIEIESYVDFIISHYVSIERAVEKRKHLYAFLRKLDQNPLQHPICRYKRLGQKLKNGEPIHTNLRRANWKDESNYQFAISYLFFVKNGSYDVIVTHFMAANRVYEDKERDILRNIIMEELIKAVKNGGLRLWK